MQALTGDLRAALQNSDYQTLSDLTHDPEWLALLEPRDLPNLRHYVEGRRDDLACATMVRWSIPRALKKKRMSLGWGRSVETSQDMQVGVGACAPFNALCKPKWIFHYVPGEKKVEGDRLGAFNLLIGWHLHCVRANMDEYEAEFLECVAGNQELERLVPFYERMYEQAEHAMSGEASRGTARKIDRYLHRWDAHNGYSTQEGFAHSAGAYRYFKTHSSLAHAIKQYAKREERMATHTQSTSTLKEENHELMYGRPNTLFYKTLGLQRKQAAINLGFTAFALRHLGVLTY